MIKPAVALLATASLAVLSMGSTSGAPSAWDLTGVWRLNSHCANWSGVNFVTIGKATDKIILGTTNVDDGYGRIVGGSFDGENFVFTNTFLYNGSRESEAWRGQLRSGGNAMRGSFKTTVEEAGGHCTFSGRRQ
jgi:hypothetical protein